MKNKNKKNKTNQYKIDKKLVKNFVFEYKLRLEAEKRFLENTITPDQFLKKK